MADGMHQWGESQSWSESIGWPPTGHYRPIPGILTRRHSNQAERTCRRHCRRQLSPTNRRPCRSTPPFAEYQDDNCQPAGHSIPRVSADRQWQKKNYLRPCRILRQYDIHKRLLPADWIVRPHSPRPGPQQTPDRTLCHCSIQRCKQLEVSWIPQGL